MGISWKHFGLCILPQETATRLVPQQLVLSVIRLFRGDLSSPPPHPVEEEDGAVCLVAPGNLHNRLTSLGSDFAGRSSLFVRFHGPAGAASVEQLRVPVTLLVRWDWTCPDLPLGGSLLNLALNNFQEGIKSPRFGPVLGLRWEAASV